MHIRKTNTFFLLLCIVIFFANSCFKFAAVQCLQNHIQPILCVGNVVMGLDNVSPFFFFLVKYVQLLFPLNHDCELTLESVYCVGKNTDKMPGDRV